jgi:hypothetical protein
MQTGILLKQLNFSIEELKTAIETFEKNSVPSTQQAEQLHNLINQVNKLLSAYVVLKEQKDISPELNIHVKLMEVPSEEKKGGNNASANADSNLNELSTYSTNLKEEIATINHSALEKEEVLPEIESKKLLPISININDKFRFINELFASNAKEYNIAIEQLNTLKTWDETNTYLTGLKAIYTWDEGHEMVKKLFTISQKRFS